MAEKQVEVEEEQFECCSRPKKYKPDGWDGEEFVCTVCMESFYMWSDTYIHMIDVHKVRRVHIVFEKAPLNERRVNFGVVS
jgi:hypothetical protein